MTLKILYKTLLSSIMIGSSSAATFFYDNEAAWLTKAGALASDVSSQTYDSATVVDGSYTTSGGTGGSVGYTLATTATPSVALSAANDFRTGTSGNGIRFTGGVGNDIVTLTVTSGTVYSFSFNIHDLFDTTNGTYGFKVEIQTLGGAFETVFDTGNSVAGIGGNSVNSVNYALGDFTGTADGSRLFGDDTNPSIGEDGSFFGFATTTQLEAIRLTKSTTVNANDNWAYDEFNVVSTAAIPEPTSFALLGLSALGLMVRRKRH